MLLRSAAVGGHQTACHKQTGCPCSPDVVCTLKPVRCCSLPANITDMLYLATFFFRANATAGPHALSELPNSTVELPEL